MKKLIYFLSIVFFALQSCSNDNSIKNVPNVNIVKNTVPLLSTNSCSNITLTGASGGGNITSDGGSEVTSRGIIWNTSTLPTINLATKTTDGIGIGSFLSAVTNLSPLTKYYVRAYATNSIGTGYGNEVVFTTGAILLPTITTTAISNITINSAISGGVIASDGGGNILSKGLVWSTTQNPTISLNTKTNEGIGVSNFSSNLTNLSQNTTYYLKAYATNISGTSYGNELIFKTNAPTFAEVATKSPIFVYNITSTRTGGYVLSDGGSAITSRGVVWSTTLNPTIDLPTKTTNGSGLGNFVSDLFNLTLNTTYHIRAYATNSLGTVYGEDVTIILKADQKLFLGHSYGGGKIAYIDSSGSHGYIVASSDQSTGARWAGYSSSAFNIKTYPDLGYGVSNTTTITKFYANGNFTNYAAKICEDLVLNGYDDWFLPSSEELDQMYLNKNSIGGFSPNWYWSSSNISIGANYLQQPGNPKAKDFSLGQYSGFPQNSLLRVRAIRKF